MLGERLKKLRKENDITQEDLGKIVGVTTSMIGMYETNARKPSYEVLIKISKYFNVSTDYLLGKTDNLDQYSNDIRDLSADEDIRRIERARKQMTPKDRKKMMEILKVSFEDYFDDADDNC